MLLHNKGDALQQCSDHHSCAPPRDSTKIQGPLSSLQTSHERFHSCILVLLSSKIEMKFFMSKLMKPIRWITLSKMNKLCIISGPNSDLDFNIDSGWISETLRWPPWNIFIYFWLSWNSVFRLGMQASRIFSAGQSLQQSSTLSHIESQLAACLLLKSAPEYKFWLQTYTRYLSQEGQCPIKMSRHTL